MIIFACYSNTDSYSLVCASFGFWQSGFCPNTQSTFFENPLWTGNCLLMNAMPPQMWSVDPPKHAPSWTFPCSDLHNWPGHSVVFAQVAKFCIKFLLWRFTAFLLLSFSLPHQRLAHEKKQGVDAMPSSRQLSMHRSDNGLCRLTGTGSRRRFKAMYNGRRLVERLSE